MLFSDNTDKLREELKQFLPFAASYDCQRIYYNLIHTEQSYIIPLLGTELYDRITSGGDEHAPALVMCRRAVANITVYENFTLINTQILPGGFSRLSGENTGNLYKYQEVELKAIFRRNGFDELDRIVDYFMTNIDIFPEFEKTDYYQSGRGELIPDKNVFSQYYKPVSYVIFKYLQPFIRRAESLDVSQIVRLDELKHAILDGNLTENQHVTLNLSRPVIICLAIAYAIDDKGVNITDAGVWLENRVAGDGLTEKNPAAETSNDVANKYRILAERYLKELQKHLSGCDSINPLIRNNNEKTTVWA